MKSLKLLLAGVAASALLGSAAQAADPVPVMVAPIPSPVAPPPAPAYDWSGLYAGAFGGPILYLGAVDWWNAGIQVGYNFVPDRILFGIEGEVGRWFSPGTGGWLFQLNARVGYTMGRVLPYAVVGVGKYPGSDYHFNIGGGVEFGLGEHLSLYADVRLERFQGYPDDKYIRLQTGLNYHF